MGAPRQLLRRQDVDENSARDEPSGEVGEEQYFEALVARLPELCVKWRIGDKSIRTIQRARARSMRLPG